MSALLQPFHLLLMVFSGWVNRRQLDLIDYIQEENRLLKERLGGHNASASPTPNVAALPEERLDSVANR